MQRKKIHCFQWRGQSGSLYHICSTMADFGSTSGPKIIVTGGQLIKLLTRNIALFVTKKIKNYKYCSMQKIKCVTQSGYIYISHICCAMINFDIDQDPNYCEVVTTHKGCYLEVTVLLYTG
jgi:hypothetical protein